VFYNNSADDGGGAIYQNHSKLFFMLNATVRFAKNTAFKYYYNNDASLKKERYVSFKTGGGGYSTQFSLMSFEHQSVETFSDNKAVFGGALSVYNTDIRFYGSYSKQPINASDRRADTPCTTDNSVMSCGDTSTVTFSGNSAKYKCN